MYDKAKQLIQSENEPVKTVPSLQIPKMTLTVEQLAEELNISKPTAYSLVKEKGFPARTIGHRVLVNRAGLQRWLDSKSGFQSDELT